MKQIKTYKIGRKTEKSGKVKDITRRGMDTICKEDI